MKAVKILFSVLALGVMTSAPVLRAQDEKSPAAEAPRGGGKGGKGGQGRGMNAENRMAELEKAVGALSAEQKGKIRDIIAKEREQMQALRPAGAAKEGDREAMRANREKMQALQKSTRGEIRAVLTADQQAKFDAMPEPARGGGQGGKGGRKKGN
jgi:Spy/CpxP family protein refolding chaperone